MFCEGCSKETPDAALVKTIAVADMNVDVFANGWTVDADYPVAFCPDCQSDEVAAVAKSVAA